MFIKAIMEVRLCKILEYRTFFINKRAVDMVLSKVDVFLHFWNELRDVKRISSVNCRRPHAFLVRSKYCFPWYIQIEQLFNCCIEAYQVNLSTFSCFKLQTRVTPNVHGLGQGVLGRYWKRKPEIGSSHLVNYITKLKVSFRFWHYD